MRVSIFFSVTEIKPTILIEWRMRSGEILLFTLTVSAIFEGIGAIFGHNANRV